MIETTTHQIEGKRITKYCGVVSAEAVLGANIFRDVFAGIRDVIGGRSASYEKELRKAKDIAIREMQEQAQRLGPTRSSGSICIMRQLERVQAC